MYKFIITAGLLVAAPGIALAQSEVEWKQTFSMPKGANLPSDRADILGIELGDTYADAKAKLVKLLADGIQIKGDESLKVSEEKRVFRIQPGGSATIITASFIAKLTMNRLMKGVTDRSITEKITVFLSAPSSGHQVIGIERGIDYYADGDQPRVSEVLAQIGVKVKAQPHVYMVSDQGHFTFQYNNGNPVMPVSNREPPTCHPAHTTTDARAVKTINEAGTCDALLFMKVGYGISRDHAKFIQFVLSDNDRTRANLSADFTFVQNYINTLQERTRGAPPKL